MHPSQFEIIWRNLGKVSYPDAMDKMQQTVENIQKGGHQEIWLLEHPPLYTKGNRAQETEWTGKYDFPIYETGRGGKFTYHGDGQRIVYAMLDLNRRTKDLKAYVRALEQWGILTLQALGIEVFADPDNVGLWVNHEGQAEKIAAIGVRVSKWVASHGIAFNVHPNLDHFNGIVPCGIKDKGVTSLVKMGTHISMDEFDKILMQSFEKVDFLCKPQQ